MATRLKNVLNFVNVAAGGQAVLPHNLNWGPRAVVPDRIVALSTGWAITADATNVTVTNLSGAVASLTCFVESWHTFERAFGASATVALTPQPIIEFASSSGGAMAGFGVQFLDSGTLNVFVDAVGGNDANDGLTAGTALQTLQEVYRKFPLMAFPDATIIVNLADDGAGGVATYPDVSTVMLYDMGGLHARYRYVGPAMVNFTPATGPVSAVLDGAPADVVDNTGAPSGTGQRTRLNFTAAAPGWTVDDFQGAFARITRGASQVIAEVGISKNGADTIFIDNDDVAAAVAAGDLVTIVVPGARIQGPAADFDQVAIQGIGPAWDGFLDPTEPSSFTRLEITGFISGNIHCSFDRCLLTGLLSTIRGGTVLFSNCVSVPQLVCYTCNVEGRDPRGTFLSGAGDVMLTAFERITLARSLFFQTRHMGIWDGALTDAIIARENSAYNTSVNIGLSGSGTPGAGIHAIHNSFVRVNGGAFTNLVGNGGALQVGTGAIIAYGTGVGQFEEAAGYDGIFTRVLESGGTAITPRGAASIITTDSV